MIAITVIALSLLILPIVPIFRSIFTQRDSHCQSLQLESQTPINSLRELYHAVSDIGDWVGLCWNLDVGEGIMDSLKHSDYVTSETKKRNCLQAYWNSGEAIWETVIRAVAEKPIKNIRVAKRIANIHKILYSCANRDEL